MNTYPLSEPLDTPTLNRQAKTGLRFLLAAITSLFFLFTIALLTRAQYQDWEALSAPWNPLAHPTALWINTAFLALSSVCMQWARVSARRQHNKSARQALLLAGIFTLAFLLGQLLLWRQLNALGFYASANPANGFFYMLTGVHGLHMLGGLIAWSKTTLSARSDTPEKLSNRIELCAIYWHYLFGIWLVLFALLISKPETFAAIASFCGF